MCKSALWYAERTIRVYGIVRTALCVRHCVYGIVCTVHRTTRMKEFNACISKTKPAESEDWRASQVGERTESYLLSLTC